MSIALPGQIPVRVSFQFGDWATEELQTFTFEQIANFRPGWLEDHIKATFDRVYGTFLSYRGKA